ncbi:unnamed protein product [Symbiodinium pilosum]|uniref:Uncharacterized protein n=1 Tax=Symbiodinium pilosum TaxID=2952 RepID=A0A812TNJ6_SYMPI|nr:unnamed protein product [Symbiodinium pilosum]
MMHALSRTGLWPAEPKDGQRLARPTPKPSLPVPSPKLRNSSAKPLRFDKARFYLQLAAGLTSDLEMEMGLKTTNQVQLGCSLFRAAAAGDAAQVRRLLDEGADPLQRHAAGQLPLHVARNPAVVSELMAACPAASAVRTFTGQTPGERYIALLDSEHRHQVQDLLLALASPAALGSYLLLRAGRSLLGLMEPWLARAVLERACGPVSFLPTGEEASQVLSKEPLSLWELQKLWQRLPRGFEAPVLRHLLLEASQLSASAAATQLQHALERVLRGLCSQEILKRAELAELSHGLMEVLASLPSCPKWSLATLVVELCIDMNKVEPTAFSALLGMLPNCTSSSQNDVFWPQRDALAWLLLGFPTSPVPSLARLERLERLEAKETMRPDEEDLRSAALALEASKLEGCRSVPEELVLAVQSVRRSAMQGVEPLRAALAWVRCARLWQRSVLAEDEVQRSVRRLLRLHQDSSIQFRCHRVQSYSEAWQKALAAWPRAIQCNHPGLLVWDLLVTEVVLPSAVSLRAMHESLQSFEWALHGAEVLWTANNFDLAGGDLQGFALGVPCLREILLLQTSHGPILVDVRLLLLVEPSRASALRVLGELLSGKFETPQRRALWAQLIRLLLADAAGDLQALLDARKALNEADFLAYAGQPILQKLQEISRKHQKMRDQEREGQDLAADLADRAALAAKFLDRLASASALFDACLPPRPPGAGMAPQESAGCEVDQGVPPSFDGTLLERYLFAKASPAAPAFGLDVTELAQHRLQALQPAQAV